MASRVGLAAILTLVLVSCLAGSARSQPPIGTAVYVVRVDPRLCPSPLCGGYWVALANGSRTRCADGMQRARCYVAKAVDEHRHPLAAGLPDGALARGALEVSDFSGLGKLGVLAVAVVYAPAGAAPVSGGFYRISDTGVRCVRAPCFSYRATQVNGRTRTLLSGIDLGAAQASPTDLARAEAALRTKNGLLARGRFAKSPDGARVFRALRLYLRVPRLRA